MIACIACDNYVHFESPQPKRSKSIEEIPLNFQGTYVDIADSSIRYILTNEAFYRLKTIEFQQLPEFMNDIVSCDTQEAFFTSFDVDGACQTLDVSHYPNLIITILITKDKIWSLDTTSITKIEGDRLFHNQKKNDYYELTSIDLNGNNIEIYEWRVSDMINSKGPLSKYFKIKRNEHGSLQFVFPDSFKAFERIDTSIYKKNTLVLALQKDAL